MIILLLMCSYTKHGCGQKLQNLIKHVKKPGCLSGRTGEGRGKFSPESVSVGYEYALSSERSRESGRANYLYNIKKKFDDRHTESGLCEWYFVLMEDFKYSVLSEMSRAIMKNGQVWKLI